MTSGWVAREEGVVRSFPAEEREVLSSLATGLDDTLALAGLIEGDAVLDRLFPRSVLFSILRAEECLRELQPGSDRVGVTDQALRVLGSVRSTLEFRPIAEILEELPQQMDAVQTGTSKASEAIRQRYFPTHVDPVWNGEVAP